MQLLLFWTVLPEEDFTLAPRPPSSPIRPNGPGGPYKYRDKIKKKKQLSEYVDLKRVDHLVQRAEW